MDWTIISTVAILALVLVVFTVIQNQRDEKDFEEKINNDFPKTPDQKGDVDDDGL